MIKAAEWFAEQPWIDPAKLSAGGGSYGGYLAEIILGREDPFKALVAHAGVYNWYTQCAADYGCEVRRFGGMWTARSGERVPRGLAALRRRELQYADARGSRRARFPRSDQPRARGLPDARPAGRPTRFVYFPDENHWVLKPQNSLLWYAEVRKWLDEWVLGIKPAASQPANGR